MENTKSIHLSHPIMIDGQPVKDLAYDTDEITIGLQAKAEAEAKKASGSDTGLKFQENDYTYHTYLGMAAILAVNPAYDWADLKRVKGRDINKLSQIGRNYFLESEAYDENSSADASEPTADGSIQA